MYNEEDCECPILVFIPASYADGIDDDYLKNPPLDGIKIWNEEEQTKESD